MTDPAQYAMLEQRNRELEAQVQELQQVVTRLQAQRPGLLRITANVGNKPMTIETQEQADRIGCGDIFRELEARRRDLPYLIQCGAEIEQEATDEIVVPKPVETVTKYEVP